MSFIEGDLGPLWLCILEDPEACAAHDWGHFCNAPLGHQDDHRCEHGHTWRRDPVHELACRLYLAYFSTRYRDEAYIPPPAAVQAACSPADSPWRQLALLALTYAGRTQ